MKSPLSSLCWFGSSQNLNLMAEAHGCLDGSGWSRCDLVECAGMQSG